MAFTVAKANSEVAKPHQLNQKYRLQHHFMGQVGWINDPNGFVYFKGQYHLFYQFYPYAAENKAKHWGHATSDDLLSWHYQPIALAPDSVFDQDGCWSGTALVCQNRLYVLYTGHLDATAAAPEQQIQCLAWSDDGLHFTKYAGNPVIGRDLVPDNGSAADFRDPKLFRHGDYFYALVATKAPDGRGELLLYRSLDLKSWTYRSVFFKEIPAQGNLIECPDFFQLDGKDVLVISTLETKATAYKYQNINSVLALIGHVDWDKEQFITESEDEIDKGLDFYGPETAIGPSGEAVMIGWMQLPGRSQPTIDLHHGWVGAFTTPRQLHIQNLHLMQTLLPAYSHYLQPQADLQQFTLQNETRQFGPFGLDVTFSALTLAITADSSFELRLGFDPQEFIALRYQQGLLTMDRSQAGIRLTSDRHESNIDSRTIFVGAPAGQLKLCTILDRSSAEILINDGSEVLTTTFYPHTFAGTFYSLQTSGNLTVLQAQFSKIKPMPLSM